MADRISSMTADDIPGVMEICAESFPDSVRWIPGSALGLRWWKNVLAFESCVVLKFVDGEQTAGFIVMVVDLDRFSRQKEGLSVGMKDYLAMAIRHPLNTMKSIVKKLQKSLKTRFATDDFPGGSNQPEENMDMNEIAWIELVAVRRDMRGKRISSRLISQCKEIIAEHGKKAIFLRVDTDNIPAIRVYEKSGFKWISASEGQSTFALML